MFSFYPAATVYPHRHHPYYSDNDYAYLDRDYLYTLAQQQAKERREAQYRAHLEAARRRVYQEQLARAEMARRRDIFLGRNFNGPSSSFHLPSDLGRDALPGEQTTKEPASEDVMQYSTVDRNSRFEEGSTKVHIQSPSDDIQETESQADDTLPSTRLSPNPVIRDAAARKIQHFIRASLPRMRALRAITAISQQFSEAQATFHFPAALDFDVQSKEDATPLLLFTPRNAALHGHEHTLMKLLTALDGVDSNGDTCVRRVRKQLVKRIGCALAELDTRKETMWKETVKCASGPAMIVGSGYSSEGSEPLTATEEPENSMSLDVSLQEQCEEEDEVEKEISVAPRESPDPLSMGSESM